MNIQTYPVDLAVPLARLALKRIRDGSAIYDRDRRFLAAILRRSVSEEHHEMARRLVASAGKIRPGYISWRSKSEASDGCPTLHIDIVLG